MTVEEASDDVAMRVLVCGFRGPADLMRDPRTARFPGVGGVPRYH